MCQQNRKNRAHQKWRHRMGNKRFAVIKDKLHAKNKEEPNQVDMFVETRTKDGKALDAETEEAIEKLKTMIEHDGKPAVEAFQSLFGKEKLGRVRCYGGTITPTILKKNEEMAAMQQKHDMEVKSLKEQQVEMVERQNQMQHQMQGMQALLKTFITQANPNLDMEAIATLLAPTPRDANSILRSSTSSHDPQNQVNDNLGDEDELHREDDHQEDDLTDLEGEEEACA